MGVVPYLPHKLFFQPGGTPRHLRVLAEVLGYMGSPGKPCLMNKQEWQDGSVGEGTSWGARCPELKVRRIRLSLTSFFDFDICVIKQRKGKLSYFLCLLWGMGHLLLSLWQCHSCMVLNHQPRDSEPKHWRNQHIWKFGDTDSNKTKLPHTCISSLNLYTYYFPVEIAQNIMSTLLYSEPCELHIHTKEA